MGHVHPLALVKSIVDPIHGLVRMTQEEHRVMDHRLFQRLRRIKQNGFLHLVFPSATHNRFEHSLGVMFVADSVLQALLYNSQANQDKLHAIADARPGQAVDLTTLTDEVTLQRIFQVTRLAALVHDLGHGPLSHSFEKFAPHRAVVRAFLAEAPLAAIATLEPILLAEDGEHPGDGPISHESLSSLLFATIWHELSSTDPGLASWVPLAVAVAILGDAAHAAVAGGSSIPSDLVEWLPLIHDIVASAPVDADRMDYMERDSRSCGVTYGIFDRSRILKSALCFRDRERDAYRLGWKRSGLRAIEVFVQARFQLFAQIYYHKTNSAANLMFDEIAGHYRREGRSVFPPLGSLADLVGSYVALGDDRLLTQLCEEQTGAGALARALGERRTWKRVFESTGGISPRQMKKILVRLFDGVGSRLVVDRASLHATKDLKRGAALLERDEHDRYAASAETDWFTASPLMYTLHTEEKKIERLYWTGGDTAELTRLRKEAHAIAGESAAE